MRRNTVSIARISACRASKKDHNNGQVGVQELCRVALTPSFP